MARSDSPTAGQATRPVVRLLRPFWWVAHAFTGYKFLALLLGGWVVGSYCCAYPIQDINNVRNLVNYLQLAGSDPLPLAADGRIDVYVFVRTGEIEGEDDLQVYANNATGQQPTLAEMLAGDYSNFGYERFRGDVSRDAPGVPLLWDKHSRRGIRIVGLSGGRIVLDVATQDVDEAYIQNIYRGHDRGPFFEDDGGAVGHLR